MKMIRLRMALMALTSLFLLKLAIAITDFKDDENVVAYKFLGTKNDYMRSGLELSFETELIGKSFNALSVCFRFSFDMTSCQLDF